MLVFATNDRLCKELSFREAKKLFGENFGVNNFIEKNKNLVQYSNFRMAIGLVYKKDGFVNCGMYGVGDPRVMAILSYNPSLRGESIGNYPCLGDGSYFYLGINRTMTLLEAKEEDIDDLIRGWFASLRKPHVFTDACSVDVFKTPKVKSPEISTCSQLLSFLGKGYIGKHGGLKESPGFINPNYYSRENSLIEREKAGEDVNKLKLVNYLWIYFPKDIRMFGIRSRLVAGSYKTITRVKEEAKKAYDRLRRKS